MKSERLLDIIGMAEDELIVRAGTDRLQRKNIKMRRSSEWNGKKVIAAAVLILCFLVAVGRTIPVKAAASRLSEWIRGINLMQIITNSDYDSENLDPCKISVNQSRSLNGITMTVKEVVLEQQALMVKGSFNHTGCEDKKDDYVQTADWPSNVALRLGGKTLADITYADDIATTTYQDKDGSLQVLFTVNLKMLKNVSDFIGKETELSFYYDSGTLEGKGFDFSFTPKKIYRGTSYSLIKKYDVGSYGTFTINTVTKDALCLTVNVLQQNLKDIDASGNQKIDFGLVDEDGTEYGQLKNTASGDYCFVRPDNADKKIYLELKLTSFNEQGVGYKTVVLGKYPLDQPSG